MKFRNNLTAIGCMVIASMAASLAHAATKTAQDDLGVSTFNADPGIGSMRADPLAVIDQNRQQVINRIMAEHAKEISANVAREAGATVEDFRGLLQSLRADRLLAASLSNTFQGVVSVVSQQAASDATQDRAKAIGSTSNDLVYTPITPCRLLDTRGVFSPQYAGGAFAAGETRTYNTRGPSNAGCGIGSTTRVRAVILQAIAITPAAAGDVEILKQGATFGNTVAMVFGAGVYSSVSIVVPTTDVSGQDQISMQVRGTAAHFALDIVGYYSEPVATKLDCKETAAATASALSSLQTVTVATERCDASIFGLYSYRAVSVNCKTGGSPFVVTGEIYTEEFTTGSGLLGTQTGERGVCTFANPSASASSNTYTATAKCCRIPGR